MDASHQLDMLRRAARMHAGTSFAELFTELDAHLSAGGTPPEAWREGPDAPAETWGWQGDPREHGDDRPERPAPEGLAVFAHWSTSHAGVNVEIDAPDGLPLTVHVNDWRAVSIVIGSDDASPFDDEDDQDDDAEDNAPAMRPSDFGIPEAYV